MLAYRPVRGDFKWTTDSDGLVHITVPKFTSSLGISFCKLIKKENKFSADMDKIGSLVWQHCDGKHSVKEIFEILEQEFPKQKTLDHRLFLFLQQMKALNYIIF